ncbi:MAG: hypothetical protein ACJA0N_000606 [Pseudohongiellaceae bacterium]|jgi:hypothetical protein
MDKSSPQTKINPFDTSDLRNYYRVNSSVKLRIAPITSQQIKNSEWPKSLSKSPAMELSESLRLSEQELHATLRVIAEQNRNVEQYLRNVNKRIDLIANYLIDTDDQAQESSEQKVLISEGGLEFVAKDLRTIKIGDCLAIELVLSLSHVSLSVFGKVVNIREDANQYVIGAEFVEMKDLDRQQLSKHVIQQQMQDKRNAKGD